MDPSRHETENRRTSSALKLCAFADLPDLLVAILQQQEGSTGKHASAWVWSCGGVLDSGMNGILMVGEFKPHLAARQAGDSMAALI